MPVLTEAAALELLKNVVTDFSHEQKSKLKTNLSRGINLLCGSRAYIFCSKNAGCLLTMSLVDDFPDHEVDLQMINKITAQVGLPYIDLIKRYGLEYFHATQSVSEQALRELLTEIIQ